MTVKFLATAALAGLLSGCTASAIEAGDAVHTLSDASPVAGMIKTSRYIESFDGTRLAISIFRPAAAGEGLSERLPVIVTQDRSDLRDQDILAMRRYVEQGYVWIAQDRRGTGASFGRQTGFVNLLDAKDAKSVIEWSAKQAFSSGKTVALGCSNQGAWQYLAASLAPASLVAIAPACASPMLFDDAVAINGIPMIETAAEPYAGECREGSSGARPGNAPPPAARPVDGDDDGSLLAAAKEEQRCGAPMLGQYWLNMPRDGYNAFSDYRPGLDDTAMTHWDVIDNAGIAVLQMGGWFDAAVAGQLDGQRQWQGRLIMGPWVHGNRVPDATALPNGDYDLFAATLAFFNRHAKGRDTGPAEPNVTWYTINAAPGHEWRSAAAWPAYPRTNLAIADNTLTEPQMAPALPAAALPRQGANWFDGRYSPLGRWFNGDFAATNAGSLLFATAAFEADREITGTPSADIWISADTSDTNIFAMLQDVAPDGSVSYITDGRIRALWRAVEPLPFDSQRTWHRGYAADLAPIEPNAPARLQFDFFPVSYVLKAGHRLQLSLARSIGKDFQRAPGSEGGQVAILRDERHRSTISLPFAPD